MSGKKSLPQSRRLRRRGAGVARVSPKKAKPKATENRCRLVYIERDTRAFHYMPWEPQSKGEELLAFGGWALANITEVHERFVDVCVQYEKLDGKKVIGDDGKMIMDPLPDPPIRLTPADIIRMDESLRHQQEVLGFINSTAQWQREIDQQEQAERHLRSSSKGGREKIKPETEGLIEIYKILAPNLQPLTPKKFIELARAQKRFEYTKNGWTFDGNQFTVEIERSMRKLASSLRTVKKRLGITGR